MRYLSLSILALTFTLVSYSAIADCPGHIVQSSTTTVATADQGSPPSTKIQVPAPKTGG